jgi:hypothetical protein
VVLHALTADGSPVRFTAKIEDGSIVGPASGEADPRESFILRLHTGEVLGDDGVFGRHPVGIGAGRANLHGHVALLADVVGPATFPERRGGAGRARREEAALRGVLWMLALGVVVCQFARSAKAGPTLAMALEGAIEEAEARVRIEAASPSR